MLDVANLQPKTIPGIVFSGVGSNNDGLGQLIVNAVSAILHGYYAAALPAGYHRNWFAAVAAQRKQKRIQILVLGFNAGNDVLFSLLCGQ